MFIYYMFINLEGPSEPVIILHCDWSVSKEGLLDFYNILNFLESNYVYLLWVLNIGVVSVFLMFHEKCDFEGGVEIIYTYNGAMVTRKKDF